MSRSVTISKWGCSLAVRIPQFVVRNLDLKDGDIATLYYEDDTITIRVSDKKEKEFNTMIESLHPFSD